MTSLLYGCLRGLNVLSINYQRIPTSVLLKIFHSVNEETAQFQTPDALLASPAISKQQPSYSQAKPSIRHQRENRRESCTFFSRNELEAPFPFFLSTAWTLFSVSPTLTGSVSLLFGWPRGLCKCGCCSCTFSTPLLMQIPLARATHSLTLMWAIREKSQ